MASLVIVTVWSLQHVINMVKSGGPLPDELHGHVYNNPLALLSRLHLTQIDGASSSQAIYLSKPTEPVKQPQRTWPRGLVTARPQKPDLLD